ncbi:hypothetical protein BSL82_05635 [Tardibacter chloracetimidivorans]|uniref:Pectate lyase superfamily protein domain-containing protein n=1 Tax=Tardibacter chloracetimidivorans TaxID=1921510 RepID=A0A1L3ZT97_9SPHN|nr:hypothetical protein [Tardibacter chloracetimidivorans]API58854.1 hypothetical protein BSL82_05635 [Tardibacter chloracetimidivorans]
MALIDSILVDASPVSKNDLRQYLAAQEFAAVKGPAFGAVGNGSAIDTQAFQDAFDSGKPLLVADGHYMVDDEILVGNHAYLVAQSMHGVIIEGTHSGAIFRLNGGAYDPIFSDFSMAGAGCTGFAVGAGGGSVETYLLRPRLSRISFHDEMTYAIDAPIIYGVLDTLDLGYEYTGSRTGGARIRSHHSVGSNYTNMTRLLNSRVFSGTATEAAIDIDGGQGIEILGTGFEQGGKALRINNVNGFKLGGGSWLEHMAVGTSAGDAIIEVGETIIAPEIAGVTASNNKGHALIRYAGWHPGQTTPTDPGATFGLDIHHNVFALGWDHGGGDTGDILPIYNTEGVSALLPADGSVSWYKNTVTGGPAGNKLVTKTDFRGGPHSPRLIAKVNTAGAGTLIYCSDPAGTLSYNGTGDVSITNLSHPLGRDTDHIFPQVHNGGGTECRALFSNTQSVRLQSFDSAGAAIDGELTVVIYGS